MKYSNLEVACTIKISTIVSYTSVWSITYDRKITIITYDTS
jgi:hypothetical protein